MIEIKGLTKCYGNFKAVDNVSITVPKGTIHGIIGENGVGKTTIIHCVTGIYKPNEGVVLIDGEDVYDDPKVKARIGFVADSNSYFPTYRVKDMVKFYKGIYQSFDENCFNELNAIFALPEDRRINQLSKGMQMRLALMLNIAIRPDVLVLDEPTSGLDALAKKQVTDILIKEVAERECTILISSHHLSELEKLCDDITMLQGGKVKYQSSVDGIKAKVKKLQAVFSSPVDLSDIEGILNIEQIGSIYHIITDDYTQTMERQLYAKGADILEEIGMSLEEIFIYSAKEQR